MVRTEAVTVFNIDAPDHHRVGVVAETKSFAVSGQAGDSTAPFSIGALQGMSGGTLLGHSRTHFYDDTVTVAFGHDGETFAPQGSPKGIGVTGLVHSSQSVAFTQAQFSAVFGSDPKADERLQTTQYLRDEGALWVPSGTATHDPARFFLATASRDPFGNVSTVTYDDV